MIPCLALVRVGRRRRVRLWLPLFVVWLLILPLTPLLAVAGLFVARAYGVPAGSGLRAAWQLLGGLRGMHLDVDTPDAMFQVRFI